MVEIHQLKNGTAKLFICHYTSRDIAINHILKSGKIRFSPLRSTNDPKEYKMKVLYVSGNYIDGIGKKFQLMVREYSKILCLTRSTEKNTLDLNTNRAFGKPRMWSQYGENHRGVCLVFDIEKLEQSIYSSFQNESKKIFASPVLYDDEFKIESVKANQFNPDGVDENNLESALIDHLENHKDAFFFHKDSDWKSENEFRFVIHKWTKGFEYLDIESSLASVILGIDFPNNFLAEMKNLCENLDVELFQLSWNSETEDFKLNIVNKST